MNKISRLTRIAGLALTVAAIAACSVSAAPTASVIPSVDEARARQIAENALDALNRGDFTTYSRDWSPTMKAAIGEKNFQAFREQIVASLGRYVSIESVALSSTKPGTYRYTFTLRFERGTGKLAFGFVDGGTLVEGVFVP
jgi:hypothetical protein